MQALQDADKTLPEMLQQHKSNVTFGDRLNPMAPGFCCWQWTTSCELLLAQREDAMEPSTECHISLLGKQVTKQT